MADFSTYLSVAHIGAKSIFALLYTLCNVLGIFSATMICIISYIHNRNNGTTLTVVPSAVMFNHKLAIN